jgi:hypothetical protein
LEYVSEVQQSLEKQNVVFLKHNSSVTLVVPKAIASNYPSLKKVALMED